MNYLVLALLIVNAILLILVVILVLRNKTSLKQSIGDNELKSIREAVCESTTALSVSISNYVAEKNNTLMNEFARKIDNLSTFQAELVNKQNEFSKEIFKTISEYNNNSNNVISKFIQEQLSANVKQKEEIMVKLSQEIKEFNRAVDKTISSFDVSIKEKLNDFKDNTTESIKLLNDNVVKNLAEIREDNNAKIEQINNSVNDKLQKTLEEKLKNSFESVIEGIGNVNKAVGEIKGIATDVGTLKSVLTNVKTKGVMGEVILGNIIREILTSGQYEENIPTKKNSSERVEFAIKLPGKDDDVVYLPVDSKFPYKPYSTIHESGNVKEIEEAKALLRNNLLKYAKDVSEKYIDVPNTTDFAIIFLPLEGLYLEALNMGLFEEIQHKYKVNLTGPTTFTAFVNSLNMGFRSLMIQKKSADVFKLLGAVKTEFSKFAKALETTQNNVYKAAEDLDRLVGTRTRLINSKLKSIEALGESEATVLLEEMD